MTRSRAELVGELVAVEGRMRMVEEHLPHPRRLPSYHVLTARRGELLGELAGSRDVPSVWRARVAVVRMLLGGGDVARDAHFEELHPRNPVGPGGGRFRSAVHGLLDSLMEHVPESVRREVGDGLTVQAELAPRTAKRLKGVLAPEWGTDAAGLYRERHDTYMALYSTATHDIAVHPAWTHPTNKVKAAERVDRARAAGWFAPSGADTPLQATMAHEYGHHVTDQFMPRPNLLDGRTAGRLIPPMARALGIDDGPLLDQPGARTLGIHRRHLDEWVRQNADQLRAQVSQYGATSFREMLAEIWGEYSTLGDQARPHIREIGAVMRDLAEGSHE